MFSVYSNDKIIHLIGIGGIGISGLAEILHNLGYIIQGSDLVNSQNTERLEKLGIKVFIGHNEQNISNADIVVFSSAVQKNNAEMLYAKKQKIPCLSRAEMLSQIVRMKKSIVVSGSHGKTTTTSICATILEMASFDPTVVNGGIINSYQSNAKLGSSDWAVIESDESDGSFVFFFPNIGIITNIDHEHISHYSNFDNLKKAFHTFIHNIPFYGIGIACIDCENVATLVNEIVDRKIITYSTKKNATFKAVNIKFFNTSSHFDVLIHNSSILQNFEIPLLGEHNIQNALAAIALSHELNINMDIVRSSLKTFAGVCRRFSKVGFIQDVLIIDDYAHHPTEIVALLSAAKQATKEKVIIICQPHRATRLNLLFDDFLSCFDLANTIILLPIYQANEILDPTQKLTSEDLYNALQKKNKNVILASGQEHLEAIIYNMISEHKITKDDIIIFSGAGTISKWAKEIVANIGHK